MNKPPLPPDTSEDFIRGDEMELGRSNNATTQAGAAVDVRKGDAANGNPDIPAKKREAVYLAKSNDPRLLDDIEAATDAKQLQRLINHLADHAPETQAMTRAIERLKEMIQSDESVAYGLQTKADLPAFRATANSKVSLTSISRSDAGVVADLISGKWSKDSPAIEFVNTINDLPQDVKESAGKETAEQDKTKGIYHPKSNSIWVILDKHATARELEETLYHEGAHFGTLTELGRGAMGVLASAFDKLGGMPGLMALAEKYGFVKELKSYRDDFIKNSPKLDTQAKLVAETLALIAERLPYRSWPQKVADSFQEYIGALRASLTSAGFIKLSSLGEADLLHLIAQGNKRLEAGGRPASGLPSFLSQMSSRMHDAFEAGDRSDTVSFSNQQANGPAANPAVRKEVKDYIEKVLGKSVKLHWAKLTHAGDFTRTKIGDIIRLSVHSLNPKSVAYHESLHAFFAQLRDANAKDIIEVIEKAASKPEMIQRLMAKFANQPAVLNQLQDPEERAAYMFQLWAEDPKGFPIAIAPRTAMEKVVAFIHRVLGTWSNDQRALHIMEYFHSGEYAKNMGKPNEVRRVLMDVNRNGALETAKEFTMPLYRLGDAIASTGDARIRDLNIPASNEIVDLIKRRDFSTPLGSGNSTVGAATRLAVGQVYTSNSNGDNGFIPAARMQATKRLNNMADRLAGYTQTQLDDALESLQSEKPASSAEGRLAAREIKAVLKETYEYMTRAGVKIGNLGPDYFPRVWDTHYISKNEQAFRDMMEPYVRSGEFKGNVTDLILGLTSREGNEFGVETSIPGMQHKKQRLLSFIKAEDAAPFLTKDLYGTLGTYITQATRRAEWDRRFGYDVATGKARMEKFYDDAKAQGAKDADFELLEKYFKSVDGTLGDDLNPKARRLMGNVMVYQNIRLLPMAAFSMMIDPLGILVRGGTAGEAFNSFKRGMASIPQSYGKKYTPDEAEKMAEMLGVVENAILSNAMGDAYTQGMVGGTAKKVNHLFFKYNGVEGMNRAFRVGATEAAMAFIKRHASLTASPHSERWMKELGLEQGDVVIMPNGQLAVSSKQGLNAGQERRIHAAVNMWVDGAIQRPNAAEKPIWMNDPHWSLIAHLKQFVWSFQETILKRVGHEFDKGNYAPAMALTSYVPMMIAVDTAKGILQNGGDVPEWKKDWGAWEYTSYGIERAGLYGVNQFGLDIMSDVERGGVGVGALGGPTIDQLADAVQAVGGNKEFAPFVLDSMPANALYKDLN